MISIVSFVVPLALAAPPETPPVDTPADTRTHPYAKLEGRVQLDYSRPLDEAPADRPVFEIRRARAAAKLYAHELAWTKLDIDLGKVQLVDLYANVGPDVLHTRIGRQKIPFSWAYIESSRFIPFAERPMGMDILAVDRTVGALLISELGPVTLTAGAGEATPLDPDSNGVEGYARGVVEIADDKRVGASLSVGRWIGFEPAFETVSGYAWATLDAPLDGTLMRGNLELAVGGPVRANAELFGLGMMGSDPLWLLGGYADVLWMVTGEGHRLNKRLAPEDPVPQGGFGAFELGLRYEHDTVRGVVHRDVDAVTAGVNWYLAEHVKVPLNYVHTWTGGEQEDAVVLRLQIEG